MIRTMKMGRRACVIITISTTEIGTGVCATWNSEPSPGDAARLFSQARGASKSLSKVRPVSSSDVTVIACSDRFSARSSEGPVLNVKLRLSSSGERGSEEAAADRVALPSTELEAISLLQSQSHKERQLANGEPSKRSLSLVVVVSLSPARNGIAPQTSHHPHPLSNLDTRQHLCALVAFFLVSVSAPL